MLNEVADATYSSPSPVRRLGGRESSSAAYVGEVGGHGQPRRRATPIPDWDEDDLYDDYVEEEEDENDHRGPFFEVEYTPNPDYLPPEPDSPDGSEPQHFFGFNRFGFPVDDYNSDDDGSYGPDSVLDEDEIDLDEDSDLDADGREYYSSDTSGAHNEDATYYDSEEEHEDSLPPEGSLSVDEDQGREVGEQGTSRTRNELEVSREDDEESAVQGSPRARDDPEEEARGDREESVASAASSSEMPGVRKRNAAGAAAAGQNSSTEPASKRRRTATATASTSATTTDTPSRRRAAPPSAEGSEAKKEAKAEDDDKFFSDEEKDEEDEILDLSKEDELPANLLVEKPDNSVRLGKLQCVICMDDATNLMITHCGSFLSPFLRWFSLKLR